MKRKGKIPPMMWDVPTTSFYQPLPKLSRGRTTRNWVEERRLTYFIYDECSQAIKIGQSVSVEARLLELQTAHATPLKPVAVFKYNWEPHFHKLFAEHHIRGEWFDSKPILDWLTDWFFEPSPTTWKSGASREQLQSLQ
jgi:hypothetical protein